MYIIPRRGWDIKGTYEVQVVSCIFFPFGGRGPCAVLERQALGSAAVPLAAFCSRQWMISGMVPHRSQAEALVRPNAKAHAGAGCSGWCHTVLSCPHCAQPSVSSSCAFPVRWVQWWGYRFGLQNNLLERFTAALSLALSEIGIT